MEKQELIEKLNKFDLTTEQLSEIDNIIAGQTTERMFIEKAETVLIKVFDSLSKSFTPHWTILLYRFLSLASIIGLIIFLALYIDSSGQVWTIIGAFIGFVFGQKSSFLRF
jgi:hypothetical protein